MPAQVRGLPRHNDHVGCTYGDFLLATRADVRFACLGRMDPPDVEAELFAGCGQVRYLLQLFQLERCTFGPGPARAVSRGRSGHASQVSERVGTARG